MRKTIAILAMLNLEYWCENDKERQELLQMYEENDRIIESSFEQYGADSLFKKDEVKNKEKDEESLLPKITEIRNESFIKKLFKKIAKLIRNA